MAETNGFARFYYTDTFSYDANLTLGDRRRITHCTGFYNDVNTNITSLKFQINNGRNAIGAGSDFRLFKVI